MLKLEAKQNGQEVEFKSNISQTVDLFASVASVLGSVTIAPGTYTEVEVKIEANPTGTAASIQLNGLFTPSVGVSIPVQLVINSPLELETEQTNVVITSSSSLIALTTLDLSTFTAGITQAQMAAATVTGGNIIISASSNSNLYNMILANITHSHHLEIEHH